MVKVNYSILCYKTKAAGGCCPNLISSDRLACGSNLAPRFELRLVSLESFITWLARLSLYGYEDRELIE